MAWSHLQRVETVDPPEDADCRHQDEHVGGVEVGERQAGQAQGQNGGDEADFRDSQPTEISSSDSYEDGQASAQKEDYLVDEECPVSEGAVRLLIDDSDGDGILQLLADRFRSAAAAGA